jgi:hypothetical protein
MRRGSIFIFADARARPNSDWLGEAEGWVIAAAGKAALNLLAPP